MKQGQHVGHVAGLYRYPVKSMAGEALQTVGVRWSGIEGDRRYAFVQSKEARLAQVDFPWFTAREHPPLVTYHAAYSDDAQVRVTAPDGETFPIESEALHARITREAGRTAALLRLGRGAYDGMPVSLVSTATVEEVAGITGVAGGEPQRYRPNIVVALAPETHEDDWVGMALAIGSDVKLWVTRRDPRCMMINLNPHTGIQQPAVLRHVARERGNYLGIYATVIATGQIAIGDPIHVAALLT